MEEILHQLIGSSSHHLQGFIHPRWLFGISSINSIFLHISHHQNPSLHSRASVSNHICFAAYATKVFQLLKCQSPMPGGYRTISSIRGQHLLLATIPRLPNTWSIWTSKTYLKHTKNTEPQEVFGRLGYEKTRFSCQK